MNPSDYYDKPKILIVDDDPKVREELEEILGPISGHKYQLITKENGQEALEYLKENDVDLIITDVAVIEVERGYQRLYHYDAQRAVVVYADVDNQQATSISANESMKAKFADVPRRYPGVNLVFGGEFQATDDAFADMVAPSSWRSSPSSRSLRPSSARTRSPSS